MLYMRHLLKNTGCYIVISRQKEIVLFLFAIIIDVSAGVIVSDKIDISLQQSIWSDSTGEKEAGSYITHLISEGYSDQEAELLFDVQDRIDTIDQAGLYVLLKRADLEAGPGESMAGKVDVMELLANPDDYRGKLLQFDMKLNPELVGVKKRPLERAAREDRPDQSESNRKHL